MSSYSYAPAPATLNVLPAHPARRLTRRDGLLPLVLALELLVGVLVGAVAHSSDSGRVPATAAMGSAPLVTVTSPAS